MNGVTLPASTEAPTSPAGTAASADGSGGFSELLSTLVADLEPAAPVGQPEADPAPAAPMSALALAKVAAPPPVLADAPALPGEPLEGIKEAQGDAALKERPQPAPAPAESPTSMTWQSPLVDPAPALTPRPVGTQRSSRLRMGENSPADASQREDSKVEPAAWTMQQALAAVAVIAAPPPALVPPTSAPASRARFDSLGSPAMPAAAMVGSGMPKLLPSAPTLPLDHAAAGDSPMPKDSVQSQAPAAGLPLDPQVLAAALNHAGPGVDASHSLPVANGPAAPGSDLDLHQLDALVRDIAAVSGESGRASFRITADQLGPIEVRLHSSDAGMAVTIRTHDSQSHSSLAQAQQQLTDDMRANGLKVAATNVMLGGGADRQRQDRPNAPAALPIEIASAEPEQSASPEEPRPGGRYA